jgi:hypothetical protein
VAAIETQRGFQIVKPFARLLCQRLRLAVAFANAVLACARDYSRA